MNKKILAIITAIFALILIQGASAANISIQGFNYNPAPAFPSETIQVIATITNNSPFDAENVVFELVLSDKNNSRLNNYPFILSPDQNPNLSLGTIKPTESAIVQFSIGIDPSALNGNYTITMKAGDLGVASRTKKFNISILSRNPQIELINSNATSIAPGEQTTIELTLKNIGSSRAINILTGIEEDRTITSGGIVIERQIYPVGASFVYTEELSPNESTKILLTLSANGKAEQRTYTVPILIQWQDENRTQDSVTRILGLRVIGEPLFDAIIDEVSPLAFSGGSSEIVFNLFNVGVSAGQNIVVELETVAGMFQKNKIFIGTLEEDDSDAFKTKLQLNNNLEPGEYPITMKISYKNSSLETRELIKTLNLRIVTQQEAQTNGENGLLNLGIIVVVIGIIGYWYYKRKKKAE